MRRPESIVAMVYVAFGFAWIVISDQAMTMLISDTQTLTRVMMLKGVFFVLCSGGLIWLIARLAYRNREREDRQKREVHAAMASAMHHVVNNFLTQTTYFRTLAEEKQALGPTELQLFDQVINDTRDRLRRLGELRRVTAEDIVREAYRGADG